MDSGNAPPGFNTSNSVFQEQQDFQGFSNQFSYDPDDFSDSDIARYDLYNGEFSYYFEEDEEEVFLNENEEEEQEEEIEIDYDIPELSREIVPEPTEEPQEIDYSDIPTLNSNDFFDVNSLRYLISRENEAISSNLQIGYLETQKQIKVTFHDPSKTLDKMTKENDLFIDKSNKIMEKIQSATGSSNEIENLVEDYNLTEIISFVLQNSPEKYINDQIETKKTVINAFTKILSDFPNSYFKHVIPWIQACLLRYPCSNKIVLQKIIEKLSSFGDINAKCLRIIAKAQLKRL